MAAYAKMVKDAQKRRRELEKEMAAAERLAAACKKEIAQLDQVISTLRSMKTSPSAGRPAGKWRPGGPGRPPKGAKAPGKKKKARTRGTWRPGGPGRPPRAWVEAQKAKAGAKAKPKAAKRKRATKKKAAK